MCINYFHNLMQIVDEMNKDKTPGLIERIFTGLWQESDRDMCKAPLTHAGELPIIWLQFN